MNPGYNVPAGLLASEGDAITPPKTNATAERELVLDQFKEIFEDLKQRRQTRERVWDQCWAMYNNQFDWSGKADWQSKIGLPHVREVVDRAAASFRKALVRMKRFYQIESETKLGLQKGLFTMNLIDYWLDQNDTEFVTQFTDALKVGLITSTMVMKVWWKWKTRQEPYVVEGFETQDITDPITGEVVGSQVVPSSEIKDDKRSYGCLGIQAVDPYNFWFDPTRQIYIERSVVDLSYVWHLYDQGVYTDREAIDKLVESSEAEVTRWKEASRKGEKAKKTAQEFTRSVELYHYWGNLYDRKGKIIQENITYTLGNVVTGDTSSASPMVMLRPPAPNGFFHKRAPYVVGSPYRIPFATYHRGIVEDMLGITTMTIELANAIVDGAQFEAAGGHEIDIDLCENPQQFDKGVHPGLAITTKGLENPNGKPVIRPITTGKVPQGALQVLQWLGREKELATSITSGLLGVPVNTRTSSEFNASMANANEGLDDNARTIEETLVNPMLELVAKTIYQYHPDFLMPRLQENFPQVSLMLADMPPKERYATMMGGFQFKARGMSIFLDKMQDRQRVIEFMQGIGTLPGALQLINWPALLEEWFMTFGWNPQKLLLTQGNQPVQAAGIGPEALQQQNPANFPGAQDLATMSPQQIASGIQGAQLGGARNNPQAASRAQ